MNVFIDVNGPLSNDEIESPLSVEYVELFYNRKRPPASPEKTGKQAPGYRVCQANPLRDFNRLCYLVKHFLDSHYNFDSDDLTGYFCLFFVIMSPPTNKMEKVVLILNRAMITPKILVTQLPHPKQCLGISSITNTTASILMQPSILSKTSVK